jgi:hypothetical protein
MSFHSPNFQVFQHPLARFQNKKISVLISYQYLPSHIFLNPMDKNHQVPYENPKSPQIHDTFHANKIQQIPTQNTRCPHEELLFNLKSTFTSSPTGTWSRARRPSGRNLEALE